MLKKLSEEKLAQVLEAGISEFAENGLSAASMSSIARRAGASVGVLYKYYADKEALFLACLERSFSVLESVLEELCSKEDKPLNYARALIGACQSYSREYGDHVRMYHEITCAGNGKYAAAMAERVESITSKLYSEIIAKAQREGNVRGDLDPKLFAFFFDNLLMMIQFSYCCPYYQERFRIFCGGDVFDRDELVTDQLLRFLESAFSFDRSEIRHGV